MANRTLLFLHQKIKLPFSENQQNTYKSTNNSCLIEHYLIIVLLVNLVFCKCLIKYVPTQINFASNFGFLIQFKRKNRRRRKFSSDFAVQCF